MTRPARRAASSIWRDPFNCNDQPSVLEHAVLHDVPPGLTDAELLHWADAQDPLLATQLEQRLLGIERTPEDTLKVIEDLDADDLKKRLDFYDEWEQHDIPAIWAAIEKAGIDSAEGLKEALEKLDTILGLYADVGEDLAARMAADHETLHKLLTEEE